MPTLDGEKNVAVRAGAQSGDRLRLRGLGIVHLGGRERGDQYIILRHANATPSAQPRHVCDKR